MKYVFDTRDDVLQRDEIATLFINSANNQRVQDVYGMTPTGYAFESRKSMVQLLSADMLAWLSAKERASIVFGVKLSKEAEIVKDVFLREKRINVGFLTREQKKKWSEKETLAS